MICIYYHFRTLILKLSLDLQIMCSNLLDKAVLFILKPNSEYHDPRATKDDAENRRANRKFVEVAFKHLHINRIE